MQFCQRAVAVLFLAGTSAAAQTNFGIYIWGSVPSGLQAAIVDARQLGFSAVRTYVGPFWDPAGITDERPLARKILRADYQEMLDQFRAVMITAYSAAARDDYRRRPVDLEAVRQEFSDFAYELGRRPGPYIVSNWEFEHDCLDPATWTRCLDYEQARIDGIAAGRDRARTNGYAANVYSAFEFTVVPGFLGRPSGMEAAARLRNVDFWSYSGWWSIQPTYDETLTYYSIESAFKNLRTYNAERGLSTRFILGEFGELWDLNPRINRLLAILRACDKTGVEYAFNWVLYDQPGAMDIYGRDASHFGKYDMDRRLTPHGEALWALVERRKRPPQPRRPAPTR